MAGGEQSLRIPGRLRSALFAGLLVTLPVAVTYLLLRWLFTTLDSVLQPILREFLNGRTVPGLGLIAGIALILVVGVITDNVLGRRLVGYAEALVMRVPLARTIYGSMKEFSKAVFGQRQSAFKQVVLVEWPRQGLFAIGFVTGGTDAGSGPLHVFVPGTPNPTSGFVILTAPEMVRQLDLTVEEALKFTIGGGMMATPDAVIRGLASRSRLDRGA